jgi:pimeloyl-ACP methyl ester carboxylesterase
LYFEDIGVREVKNIAKPVHVFFVRPSPENGTLQSSPEKWEGFRHDVRFCMASDGVQIAYSAVGEGPPLVRTANWLNHLEYDWKSPVWRHALRALAEDYCLVRYDQRGAGLSDLDVADISFEAWIKDLETVVDAAGLERFSILGISQGCSVAIAYAVRHPERVSALVLYGGYTRGRNKRGEVIQAEQDAAMLELIRIGWGQANPAFRQVFTSLIFPDATQEQMEAFNELQRRSTTPDNAVRIRETSNNIEVSDLAPQVAAPTLVMHVRDDATVPFEEGRRLAARIPGAHFVALEGRNHLILEDEPAWPRFLEEIRSFFKANQNGK